MYYSRNVNRSAEPPLMTAKFLKKSPLLSLQHKNRYLIFKIFERLGSVFKDVLAYFLSFSFQNFPKPKKTFKKVSEKLQLLPSPINISVYIFMYYCYIASKTITINIYFLYLRLINDFRYRVAKKSLSIDFNK
jgi:hypothetical protein